mgnify:CR=1 FL=1
MEKGSNFINELSKDRNIINKYNDNIIEIIIEKCTKNIKLLNNIGNTECIYDVPTFLLGYPLYDIEIISYNINKKLKKLGLYTIYIKPNKIYISWK